MRSFCLLGLAALALVGCPNTDPAVFVDPTISDPSLTVGSASVLEKGITGGSFSLDLHLGARAAGPSTVKLGAFTLLNSTMADTLASLQVDASSGYTNGTGTVQPDSDLVSTFAIEATPLPPAGAMSPTIADVCSAGGIVIEGVFNDSLKGTTVPVYSDIFQPTGCSGE